MRPIWDPSGQSAYQTHVKPGCTPHWIHGTHIGMFARMYLHVHEPVRHYTYHSATDSKSGLFLKPFLTFITYRLPWQAYRLLCHGYGSLSCATKWSIFSRRIGSLAVLFLNITLLFYETPILKAKQTLLVRGWNIKRFLLWCRPAKLSQLLSFASFSNAN